ncbi:MAG TPA: MlaD family protein [Longimicrobiales bacterium]
MAGENSVATGARQSRRVIAGTIIIALLTAFALLIFFLDDLRNALREDYAIYAIIAGGTGLVDGSPVWVSGRPIGTVTAVGLLPAGGDTLERVLLRIELPRSVQSQVRADSRVQLASINIMSERAVDIVPGSAGARVLSPGDTLREVVQLKPGQLTERAETVKRELDSVLAELSAYTPAIRARLAQTQRAFDGLGSAVEEARVLQADLDANPGYALLRDPAFRASLENARAHAAALPSLVATLRERAAPASEVRLALARLQQRVDTLSARLAEASAVLADPNGTLARMQQDSALTRAIGAARAELDSLLADVRRNPLRYVF